MSRILTNLLIAAGLWTALMAAWWLVVVPLLRRGPRGDAGYVLLWCVLRAFVKLRHRVRYVGREHIPAGRHAGPLVIVSNHTGAIDPLLISAACPFEVRWMMAEDMFTPKLEPFLDFVNVIPVARTGRDTASARVAVRHLRSGGVIGIFPEGGIVTPPRQVWPFFSGVGLIIARSKAPVLLVWVSGTPDTNDMTGSIVQPSRARVQFIGRLDFTGERDAKKITDTLREKIAEVSGWPMKDGEAVPRLADVTVAEDVDVAQVTADG